MVRVRIPVRHDNYLKSHLDGAGAAKEISCVVIMTERSTFTPTAQEDVV